MKKETKNEEKEGLLLNNAEKFIKLSNSGE
jgi:hypothetical protein